MQILAEQHLEETSMSQDERNPELKLLNLNELHCGEPLKILVVRRIKLTQLMPSEPNHEETKMNQQLRSLTLKEKIQVGKNFVKTLMNRVQ